MNGFQVTEHIAAPPFQVFAVISDPRHASGFLDQITTSIKLTEGPIGVGTTFRESRVVNGKESTADLLVTDFEPDTLVAISTQAEGITVAYRYRLATEAGGTRVEWTCELDARGLRRMMLPMVATIMKKEDGDHLQRLKAYIESRRHETA